MSGRLPYLAEGACIAVLASFLFAYGMDQRDLLRASEGRVARAAQEMLDRGEWVLPYLNGEPRIKKPPLASWAVMLWALAFEGGVVTERAAFAPSVLAGVLSVLLVYAWRARLRSGDAQADRSAGFLAALVLAGSLGFLGQARQADLDIWLALFTVLAFWAWERYRLEGASGALAVFYLALALGFLTKGHVILVTVVPPLLIWRFMEARRGTPEPSAVRPWRWHAIGIALFLLLVLGWGIPFLQRSGLTWEGFQKEGLDRFDAETSHQEAPYWYLANVPLWMAPWIAWLPFAIAWQLKKPADALDPRRRLWWLWFGVNLMLWSCLTGKQRHYAIPWLVPLALLIGDGIVGLLRAYAAGERRADLNAGRWSAIGLGLLLAFGSLGLAGWAQYKLDAGAWVWIFAGIGAVSFLLGALKAARVTPETCRDGVCPRICWIAWWGGVLAVAALYTQTFERAENAAQTEAGFCLRVRAAVPPDAPLYDTGLGRPHLLFYLGRNVGSVENEPEVVLKILRSEPRAYLLLTAGLLEKLPPGTYVEALPSEPRSERHRYGACLIQGTPAARPPE